MPHVRYREDGILNVMSTNVATIKAIHEFPDLGSQAPDLERTAEAVRNVMNFFASDSAVDRESMVETLCRTLCCNEFSERYAPPDPNHCDYAQTMALFLTLSDSSSEASPALLLDNATYLDVVYSAIFGRVFSTTESDHMGLAPKSARKGDQVYVLLGCQSPMLLRPGEPGRWSVVGECYTHGFMDGEALLGSLPGSCNRVARAVPGTPSLWDAFIDRKVGVLQISDPRLGPLPCGWRIENHPMEELYSRFQEEATGAGSMYDPGMFPEALRGRRVALQEIALVSQYDYQRKMRYLLL